MAKTSFINDLTQVGEILDKIGNEGVRLFEGPASYYKMRRLEDEGLIEHKMLGRTGERGHALVGFGLTTKGKQIKQKAHAHAKRPAKGNSRGATA